MKRVGRRTTTKKSILSIADTRKSASPAGSSGRAIKRRTRSEAATTGTRTRISHLPVSRTDERFCKPGGRTHANYAAERRIQAGSFLSANASSVQRASAFRGVGDACHMAAFMDFADITLGLQMRSLTSR